MLDSVSMPVASGAWPKPTNRSWILVVIVMLVLAAVIWAVISQSRPKNKAVETKLVVIPDTILSPGFYTDFVGSIVSIENNVITVEHGVTGLGGKTTDTKVAITINQQTKLNNLVSGQSESTYPEISLTTLKADDRVHVFGADNVAGQEAFTATKIYRLGN